MWRENGGTEFLIPEPPPPYDGVIPYGGEQSPHLVGEHDRALSTQNATMDQFAEGNGRRQSEERRNENRAPAALPILGETFRNVPYLPGSFEEFLDESMDGENIYEDPLSLLRSASMGFRYQQPMSSVLNVGNEPWMGGSPSSRGGEQGIGCLVAQRISTPVSAPRSVSSATTARSQLQPDGPYHISPLYRESPNVELGTSPYNDTNAQFLTAQRMPKIRLGTTSLQSSRPDRSVHSSQPSGDFSGHSSQPSGDFTGHSSQPNGDFSGHSSQPSGDFSSHSSQPSGDFSSMPLDDNYPYSGFPMHATTERRRASDRYPSTNRPSRAQRDVTQARSAVDRNTQGDPNISVHGQYVDSNHRRSNSHEPRRWTGQRPSQNVTHQRTSGRPPPDIVPQREISQISNLGEHLLPQSCNGSIAASSEPRFYSGSDRSSDLLGFPRIPQYGGNDGFTRPSQMHDISQRNEALRSDNSSKVNGGVLLAQRLGLSGGVNGFNQYRDQRQGLANCPGTGSPLDSFGGHLDNFMNPTSV